MRIVVVVNKYWEADPVIGVLSSDGNREWFRPRPVVPRARPPGIGPLELRPVLGPEPGGDPAAAPAIPRLTFQVGGAAVEVWALQDLMDPTKSSSLSAEKVRVLGRLWENRPPASIIVAVGTAAAPSGAGATNPGSVVVGQRFLLHDGDPTASERVVLPPGTADALLDSGMGVGGVDVLGPVPASVADAIRRRFLRPPSGDEPMDFRISDALVSVGTINIVRYSEYKKADPKSLGAFEAAASAPESPKGLAAASVETTHGLIGLAARQHDTPFMWVSGIANAVGAFDDVVAPREYAQDFAAAHNAGVAVAWLLPEIVRALRARP